MVKLGESFVIGNVAPWISYLCKELFPGAKLILDFYDLSESVNNYAKLINAAYLLI